ncbi:MAG: paraquat-inducible protein A [Rhodobacterales bacterium]|jgi:paraquat-inducible protein A|nr:paraquat-inducible protein A [Rhodobacterales bacterium]
MNLSALPLEDLIACPRCDALYHAAQPAAGERAVCGRCHSVLIAPRRRAGMTIIMMALTVTVLVLGALWFPFLRISTSGLQNSSTLLDAALSFVGGPLLIVSLAVVALIVLVPLTRALLILYVLVPIVFDRPPRPSARAAFRLAEELRPWSMAEIFAIGCAVSLVKVADLADISFGPAFYMFAGLVVVSIVQDTWMCRWSVWKSLDGAEGYR